MNAPTNLDLRKAFLSGQGTDSILKQRLDYVNKQLGISDDRGDGEGNSGGSGTGHGEAGGGGESSTPG